MTQGVSIEHMQRRRRKKAREAQKKAEICQYFKSNPAAYQCKLMFGTYPAVYIYIRLCVCECVREGEVYLCVQFRHLEVELVQVFVHKCD